MDRAAKHIRPMLGSMQIGKIDVFVLEALYADLARCRDHCHRRKYIDHRTPARLRIQVAGIRAIHFILRGALRLRPPPNPSRRPRWRQQNW
jgi:integrase